jgi:hypothetical protein
MVFAILSSMAELPRCYPLQKLSLPFRCFAAAGIASALQVGDKSAGLRIGQHQGCGKLKLSSLKGKKLSVPHINVK